MRILTVMKALLTVLTFAGVSLSGVDAAADPTLSQQDRQGPVTVGVTLVHDEAGAPMRVKVVLDTHSVDLESIELRDAVVMRLGDGREVLANRIEEAKGDAHHRQATLVFSAPAAGPVQVVVKNVGNVSERVFRWDAVGR
jgi:hypothetical protein